MDIRPGLFGKYELQERLGRGGMAEVWKAFDPRLRRYVAIKFLHAALQSDPTFVSRFVREARAVASLRHPNIVQIYDFETPAQEAENVPAYMVMDYIEGPTLANYLRDTSYAHKFPSATEMVSLFLSISDAIDYAHQRGLLHRDIKPANILLDQRHTTRNPMGEPMLTDFGIVKMLGTTADTLTLSTVGTPIYISPERIRGYPGSSVSDIYSLGVILYEMCTGVPPFQGDSVLATLQQHVSAPPRPPESINPAISPEQAEVILHGLAKEPGDRFPNAIALTTALAEALNVPLPDRQRQPISSPDIRSLPDVSEDLQDSSALTKPVIDNGEQVLLPPAMPPTFLYPSSSRGSPRASFPGGKVPESAIEPVPVSTPRVLRPPHVLDQSALYPARQRKRRGIRIVLIALLMAVVVSSGLVALFVSRGGFSSTHLTQVSHYSNIVGHASFTSSGAAPGANNINDTFQVHLSNVPLPQAGNSYYAWLLPDQTQSEASSRPLGTLVVTNGVATLSSPYVDPKHENLLIDFSRFLVTEEPKSPVPLDSSLDKGTWRYYAEIPQNPPLKDCLTVINQLNDLCHLRHLLSGDPELAQVHLPGGLNYWLLNNVQEIEKWAGEIVDGNDPVGIRYKVVDILYLLDGRNCIARDLLRAAPGRENTPDDGTVKQVAAIPLLDCSLTPNVTSYLRHIHNHLNAIVLSPGVLKEQVMLADAISTELNTINAWLSQVQQDASQLVALDDPHLVLAEGKRLGSDMDTLARMVLNGGIDPHTGTAEKGVASIADQIQQLATMDVTRY